MWNLVLVLAVNALIGVFGWWVHRMFPQIPNWALLATVLFLAFGIIPIAAFDGWRKTVFIAALRLAVFIRQRWWSGIAMNIAWTAAPFAMIGGLLWLIVATYQWTHEPGTVADPDRYAPLWIRAIYDTDSADNRFIVMECERSALKVGRMFTVQPNPEWATSSFRRCLTERGLAWEQCKNGEARCGLFESWRVGIPATYRSQFIENP